MLSKPPHQLLSLGMLRALSLPQPTASASQAQSLCQPLRQRSSSSCRTFGTACEAPARPCGLWSASGWLPLHSEGAALSCPSGHPFLPQQVAVAAQFSFLVLLSRCLHQHGLDACRSGCMQVCKVVGSCLAAKAAQHMPAGSHCLSQSYIMYTAASRLTKPSIATATL